METPEYETFYKNVIGNEEMLRKMAQEPHAMQEVFDKAQELNGGGGFPGGDYFRLQTAVADSILVKTEVAEAFSDDDMLLIYKSNFEKWFALEGFKDRSALGNPIFAAIQNAFTVSSKLDHVQCFEYLCKNVDISSYDIDALDMLIAIKAEHKYILETIWLHAPKDKYGKTGSLGHMIGPQLRETFHSSEWMTPILKNKLSDFDIIRGV